jgi:antirestriction protein
MSDTPQVWLACLAAYNAGHLHGKWVDATDADELHEAAEQVLKSSPVPGAEEIAVHDYNNFSGAIIHALGEYPDFETLARLGSLIEQHGRAFLAFCDAVVGDVTSDTIEEVFEACLCGEFDSEKAYAYEQVEELGWGDIPAVVMIAGQRVNVFEKLSGYLDWDAIERDLFYHGECVFKDGYVFDMERSPC